jgi:hypothetical protein
MVRVERAVRTALEDADGEARERALRAALDEDARVVRVHALDLRHPLDGRGDLLRGGCSTTSAFAHGPVRVCTCS